jgi:hypothetical protein
VIFNKIQLPRIGTHPLSPATELSAHSAEFRPYSAEYFSNGGNFWTTALASVACSSGGRSESRGFCSADTGVGNSLHVRRGPSGPILSYLIHFEFQPAKRQIFGEISSPVILEFHLVFYMFFQIFLFQI